MSAETLRRAASLMRESADKVPGGPWDHGECDPKSQAEQRVLGQFSVIFGEEKILAPVPGPRKTRQAFAEYAASWHPIVALAVANWLEATASDIDSRQRNVDGLLAGIGTADGVQIVAAEIAPDALAVARAYLGESS